MTSSVEDLVFGRSKRGPESAKIGAGGRGQVEHNARPLENPMRDPGPKGNNGLEGYIGQRGKIGIR